MDNFNKVSEGFADLRINCLKEELKEYGEKHRLRGLEGRIERGLDPAGILAVNETRNDADFLVKKLGGTMEELEKFTNEMHVGGVWDNAERLADSEDAEASTWMILAQVTDEDKKVFGDIGRDDFLKDLKRIRINLTQAKINPRQWRYAMQEKCANSFEERYGIPYCKEDTGFVAMAVAGHKAGIVEDDRGLLFVGSKKLDCSFLETEGYKKETREDRGRKVDFFVDKNGNDVAKQLYPGFVIVLNKDLDLAEKIVANNTREELDKFAAEARRLRVQDMEAIQDLAQEGVDRAQTKNMVWGYKDKHMKNRLKNTIYDNVFGGYFGYEELKKYSLPMAKMLHKLPEEMMDGENKLKKWMEKTLENEEKNENKTDILVSKAIDLQTKIKQLEKEIEETTKALREKKLDLEKQKIEIANELKNNCPIAHCQSTDHEHALEEGDYYIYGLPKNLISKKIRMEASSKEERLYIDEVQYEGEWEYAEDALDLLNCYIYDAERNEK